MDDSYCLLPERISEQFSEIDSDIVMDLAAASPEYTELKAQMEELKRQNLVIGGLLPVQQQEHHHAHVIPRRAASGQQGVSEQGVGHALRLDIQAVAQGLGCLLYTSRCV